MNGEKYGDRAAKTPRCTHDTDKNADQYLGIGLNSHLDTKYRLHTCIDGMR